MGTRHRLGAKKKFSFSLLVWFSGDIAGKSHSEKVFWAIDIPLGYSRILWIPGEGQSPEPKEPLAQLAQLAGSSRAIPSMEKFLLMPNLSLPWHCLSEETGKSKWLKGQNERGFHFRRGEQKKTGYKCGFSQFPTEQWSSIPEDAPLFSFPAPWK